MDLYCSTFSCLLSSSCTAQMGRKLHRRSCQHKCSNYCTRCTGWKYSCHRKCSQHSSVHSSHGQRQRHDPLYFLVVGNHKFNDSQFILPNHQYLYVCIYRYSVILTQRAIAFRTFLPPNTVRFRCTQLTGVQNTAFCWTNTRFRFARLCQSIVG